VTTETSAAQVDAATATTFPVLWIHAVRCNTCCIGLMC